MSIDIKELSKYCIEKYLSKYNITLESCERNHYLYGYITTQ